MLLSTWHACRGRKRLGGFRFGAGGLTHSPAGFGQRKPPKRFRRSAGTAAFSLLEVVVAASLFLMAALGLTLSLIFADRVSFLGALQLSAAHTLQGQVERLRGVPYGAVTAANFPDLLPGGDGAVFLDAERGVPATVNFDILEALAVQSATAGAVTIKTSSIPVNAIRPSGAFAPDELAGNILLVESGRGSTQRGYIKGNTADTIRYTADESGATQTSFAIAPDATSRVQINMGKVATVRVSWNFHGHNFSEEMRTLVILPPELAGF